ncbi:hypothetical protein NTE05_001918 [Vibrio harveyi]|nr:hypothetical protein [Vibrio harveyi]
MEVLRRIFQESLTEFFDTEVNNIQNDVAERNLCGRFAMILEPKAKAAGFLNYFADTEYNRNRGKVKTILDDNSVEISITCDLILHSRGKLEEQDNLIALEMKKSSRPDSEEVSDCNRLRIMTKPNYDSIYVTSGNFDSRHVCGYKLGYFLWLDSKNRQFRVREFSGGQEVNEFSGSF